MPRVRNLTTDVASIPLLRIIAETPGSAAICRDLDGLQSTSRACVRGAERAWRSVTAHDSRDVRV